jgi:hypothetical protein
MTTTHQNNLTSHSNGSGTSESNTNLQSASNTINSNSQRSTNDANLIEENSINSIIPSSFSVNKPISTIYLENYKSSSNTYSLFDNHRQPNNEEHVNSSEKLNPEENLVQLADRNSSFKLQKERDEFIKRLVDFHRHKSINTPLNSWPTINGRPINLQKLYAKVIALGGWERVCERDKWNDIAVELDPLTFGSCTNGSQALKLIYVRYLSLYEKVHSSSAAASSSLNTLLDSIPNLNPNSYLNTQSTGLISSATSTNSLNILGSVGGKQNTNGAVGFSNSSASANLSHRFSSTSTLASSITSFGLMDDRDDDLLMTGRRRFSYLLEATPMIYNHSQHTSEYSISSTSSIMTSLSTSIASLSNNNHSGSLSNFQATLNNHSIYNPYEKLEKSLLSGLPNEVDFVFNTILLLSSDETHLFRVYSSPLLIDLMLAHIGFFGAEDKHGYRLLYDNVWHSSPTKHKKLRSKTHSTQKEFFNNKGKASDNIKLRWQTSRRQFVKFWHNSVELPAKSFDEDKRTLIENLLPKLYNEYLKDIPSSELMSLREWYDDEEGLCSEYRRIEQVMIILNNLSFEDNNATFMANQSGSLLEFLIMCLFCKNRGLLVDIRKHALDILANLSRCMKLRCLSDKHRNLLFLALEYLIVGQQQKQNSYDSSLSKKFNAISSQNHLDLLRGLEIFTKLCAQRLQLLDDECESNERIISSFKMNLHFTSIPEQNETCLFLNSIIFRLEELLSVQDVLILMNCLELLYNSTQYSQTICNMIVNSSPKIVSMLVDYLSVDMSHFGMQTNSVSQVKTTSSLIGTSSHSHNQQQPQQHLRILKVIPSTGSLSQQNSIANMNMNTTSTQIVRVNQNLSQSQFQPLKVSQTTHPISPSSSSSSSSALSSQSLIQQHQSTSLLQQTLFNQHNKISNVASLKNSTQEQAKLVLIDW